VGLGLSHRLNKIVLPKFLDLNEKKKTRFNFHVTAITQSFSLIYLQTLSENLKLIG